MSVKYSIPKIPHAFFKWYCDPRRYEELHGDLEELFYERAKTSGMRAAQFHYLLDVIRCCQPYAWRRRQAPRASGFILYRSYFTIAIRGLMKNPLNAFINVFGLAVAIGICILVYGFFQWDHNIDRFHKNSDEVFLITWFGSYDNTLQQYGTSPRPLGEMLKENFAHIKKVCRVEDKNVVVKYGDHVFHEQIRYVDPEFLDMFTFPLKWGSPRSLRDASSIILSEPMSVKYFGTENPIGRELLIKFGETQKKLFKVSGVAAPFPKAHDIDFNFLVNYSNLWMADPSYKRDDWSKFVHATLIQVDDAASIEQITSGMEKYRRLQNQIEPDRPIKSFVFEPLTTLHERAGNIQDAIAHDYNQEGRIGLPVVALLLLALACFNYINIAIVSATRRLKEIGIRKVIGATRGKMVVQFIAENIITTFFALVVGFVLSVTVFIPWFEQFSGGEMLFDVLDRNLFMFLLILLLFTGLASGVYPAFYIAHFDAVKIFKGAVIFGKKNPLTKLFLGIQMILACVLITTGVVFTQNNVYQSGRSWGYQQQGVLYASLPDSLSFPKLRAVMEREPSVASISGSTHHIGKHTVKATVHLANGVQHESEVFAVDADYFETMGLALHAGRWLRDRSENDRHAVVINEVLAKNMGLENVVGTTIEIDSSRFEIIGIVKDFHNKDLFNTIQPALFRMADESNYQYLSLQVKPGTEKQAYTALQAEWSKLFPEVPFDGGYQRDVWGIYFERVDRSQTFSIVVAAIAVFLASMGLFGLVTINVSGRTKEFSIRKMLGARTNNIIAAIVNQYIPLIAAVLIVGVPVSFIFTKASLNMLFAYPMPVGYTGIIVAGFILLFVFLSVVSTQVRKVVKTNPVDGLKND